MENISNILTVKEVAVILRCSNAHVHNAIHGKVHGLPKLTHLTMAAESWSGGIGLSSGSNPTKPDSMAACSVLPLRTQGKEKRMRRKPFPRGCLKSRKRNGKNHWYAQWREEGKPKSKEIGLCSKMDRVKAEGILTEILKPINEGAENPDKITWTFAKFCEVVYLPVCHQKWKASTDMVEANRLEVHLVRPLGEKFMQEVTRSELQALLDG